MMKTKTKTRKMRDRNLLVSFCCIDFHIVCGEKRSCFLYKNLAKQMNVIVPVGSIDSKNTSVIFTGDHFTNEQTNKKTCR